MITITRKSPFTGKLQALEIPLTQAQYDDAMDRWVGGTLLQNAFPTLDAGQREFIKTGISPQEWAEYFVEDN